jgi:hypothetical protein
MTEGFLPLGSRPCVLFLLLKVKFERTGPRLVIKRLGFPKGAGLRVFAVDERSA